MSDNRHVIGIRDQSGPQSVVRGVQAAMQSETPTYHRISADDRILLDYWRKQLVATMLSGDEDASVQANLMLHKLIAKYQNCGFDTQ